MTGDMEIVCVGNELLIGKVLNTNAQWIAKQATNLGITVKRVTIVPDEIEEIVAAIREAIQRKPQFIITTGGLGPTFDDKTLQGVARALNRNLEVTPEALRLVKEKYEAYAGKNGKTKVELTPPRIKMATIPEKTTPIPNPIGTAPGVRADKEETVLIALPGVPREMEAIFNETVTPMLKQASHDVAFYEKSIYADNVMESNLAPIIDEVMGDNPSVYIKSHPRGGENKPHMEIHLSIKASNSEKPLKKLEKAAAQLEQLIGKSGGKTSTRNQTVNQGSN